MRAMPEVPPSIFNDVLGPVMRGPSSSHSAAGNRIGRLCRDLVGGELTQVVIDYDPSGSLPTTHKSQGTDLGLYGGFLGWDQDDERLLDYEQGLERAGLAVEVRYVAYGAEHPNTYRLELHGRDGSQHRLQAISTGGGMIIVEEIDGTKVEIHGDYYETLLYTDQAPEAATLTSLEQGDDIEVASFCAGQSGFVRVQSRAPLSDARITELLASVGATRYRALRAVLPVLGSRNMSVPFVTHEEMLAWNEDRGLELWELARAYEAARGGISEAEVEQHMEGLLDIFEAAVQTGLGGTHFEDRILPAQSPGFRESLEASRLVEAGAMNRVIMYVTAIMEVKSSMGVIIAAPTAGSCGAMPGAVLGVADSMGLDRQAKVRALLIAGLIGVFIAHRATFAAEVGGCMAECGSGSGMAAAAIAQMAGGTLEQQLGASSLALQNSFGMICDPVANRVEAPCLGRNTMAATNALSCANMALAGYRHLIPLDEVLIAMDKVGHALPHELCCTGKGGLSITPSSKAIEERLGSTAAVSGKPGC